MKYISDYRDPDLATRIISNIGNLKPKKKFKLMEVCGTHTVAISKSGVRKALADEVQLLSGPGCPVCVTDNADIDQAIELGNLEDAILVTFGDMMKVPGSYSSLDEERAKGADIRVVYSPLDALEIAKDNPNKKVIFLGVGFETTTPTIAFSVFYAKKEKINNYSVLGFHKLIPPAMEALLDSGDVDIDGFICPGHVSVIIGSIPYKNVAQEHGIPCVISGFESLDILQSIHMLIQQKQSNISQVEIQYRRGVTKDGNKKAREIVSEVFEVSDAKWRGIGVIPKSGLKFRDTYSDFDASAIFDIKPPPPKEISQCSCGDILRGVKLPYECRLFGKACAPGSPVGPCMVSSEGACATYFKYDFDPP